MMFLPHVLLLSACGSNHTPRSLNPVGDVTVIGHRGAADLAPENTMAAFAKAAELGTGFELDVTLTADGHVVVIHDDTLERTTDGTGPVKDMSLQSMRQLDAGSWYSNDFARERVPTLGEVLRVFGGRVPINIELKTSPDVEPLVEAVAAEVRNANVAEHVFVTSFNPMMLAHMAEVAPELRRGQLTHSFPRKDSELSLLQRVVLRRMWLNRRARPDFVVVNDERATGRFVERWHNNDMQVLVYTVNDPQQMTRLYKLGVDGIITDRPDLALEAAAGNTERPSLFED